jgi:hypothetical protein
MKSFFYFTEILSIYELYNLRTFKNAVEINNKLKSNRMRDATSFLSKISANRFGSYYFTDKADCAQMPVVSVASNSVTENSILH